MTKYLDAIQSTLLEQYKESFRVMQKELGTGQGKMVQIVEPLQHRPSGISGEHHQPGYVRIIINQG